MHDDGALVIDGSLAAHRIHAVVMDWIDNNMRYDIAP